MCDSWQFTLCTCTHECLTVVHINQPSQTNMNTKTTCPICLFNALCTPFPLPPSPPPTPPTPCTPDLFIGVLEGEAELLHVAKDEGLVLMQHPVPLLLVFLCLQVRSMKLSNARAASRSAAARLPLPEGENHESETEQCHHMLVQHLVLLVFFCLKVRTMKVKLSNAIICSYSIQACSSSFAQR
jgi:hypothetical protein